MKGSEICTYTGKIIDPLNPDPALIDIEDIAHSLANQCRFTGHTKFFYSVAEHSVNVASRLTGRNAKAGLLHDGSEAYLSDLARPIKKLNSLGKVYASAERGLEIAIAERFKLDWPWDREVKQADDYLLLQEATDLMPSQFFEKETNKEKRTYVFECYTPESAEAIFLETYAELFG